MAIRNFTGNIYDELHPRPEGEPDPLLNLRTETVYLGNGNVDYVEDELGKQTHYDYDDLGRLTKILDPLSNPTEYAYDANGNRTRVTTIGTNEEGLEGRYPPNMSTTTLIA